MSLIGAFMGERQTVVLADSRGWLGPGRQGGDRYQKLFQAGERTALAIGGTAGVRISPNWLQHRLWELLFWCLGGGSPSLVSNRVMKLCSESNLADRPRELLLALRDDLHEPMVRSFAKHPEKLRETIIGQEVMFVAACFRRSGARKMDLWELRLPVAIGPDGKPAFGEPEVEAMMDGLILSRVEGYFSGTGGVQLQRLLAENPRSFLNPDLSDELVIRSADRLGTEIQTEETGGPIDVAALNAEGFRWLRRKGAEVARPARSPALPVSGSHSRPVHG